MESAGIISKTAHAGACLRAPKNRLISLLASWSAVLRWESVSSSHETADTILASLSDMFATLTMSLLEGLWLDKRYWYIFIVTDSICRESLLKYIHELLFSNKFILRNYLKKCVYNLSTRIYIITRTNRNIELHGKVHTCPPLLLIYVRQHVAEQGDLQVVRQLGGVVEQLFHALFFSQRLKGVIVLHSGTSGL